MSGNVPFGFGPAGDDDPDREGQEGESGDSGSAAGGSGDAGNPLGGFGDALAGMGLGGLGGPGGTGNFDMSQLGAMLQQLGQMLQGGGEGPVNWDLATNVARQALVQAGDPVVSDAEKRAVDDAARLADLWLDPVMSFPSTSAGAEAWSRSQWLERTLPAWRRIVEPIAEQVQDVLGSALPGAEGGGALGEIPGLPEGIPPELAGMMGPLMGMARQMGASMFGMQVGQGLAALASEVVGAADIGIPLTTERRVVLLPRNVAAFGDGLDVPGGEVMLYLALREAAHQRLFAHVPWLGARLEGAVQAYARGIHVDVDRLREAAQGVDPQNPEALQEALSSGVFEPEDSPEQKAALARLETLLALVEGWVDDVVDAAVDDRLPSAARLREAIRRRRGVGGPAEKTFATLVGLEMRPRRLREAAEVWRSLRESGGMTARDALWGHPDLLPTAEDLDDPVGFTTRSAPLDLGEIERSLGQDLDGDGLVGDGDAGDRGGDDAGDSPGGNAEDSDAGDSPGGNAEDSDAGDGPDRG